MCDFDGTITVRDTVDVLLSELADPAWEEIEEQWVRGEIGSRECMARQIPLIRGGWPAVQRILDKVEIEPDFAGFVGWCRSVEIPVIVVSDGLDRVIRYLFDQRGIVVNAVYANHLVEKADGSFSLISGQAAREPGCQSGVCKCRIADAQGKNLKVVIGDGRSDFCWAKEADLLFAKHKLADHCRSEHIPYIAYDSFTAIQTYLKEQSVFVPAPPSSVFGSTPFSGGTGNFSAY